jgi:hypothetical protein
MRAPRDHRVPANEEDLADFETDVGARADMQDRRCVSPVHWRVRLRAGRALPSRSRMLYRQEPRPATDGGFQQTSRTGPV